MSSRLFLLGLVVFFYSMPAAPSIGAANTAREQPQVFTNQDIEKYKDTSDTNTIEAKPVLNEDREKSLKYGKKHGSKEHGMEVWCNKATACNRKIEAEKEAIKEIEDDIVAAKTKGRLSNKRITTLEKKLDGAKKHLRKAEGRLTDLEDEAHRKEVPPGWLRCQN